MKRRNIIISSICAVALTVGLMPNKEAKAFDIENPVIESYRDFGDLYPELKNDDEGYIKVDYEYNSDYDGIITKYDKDYQPIWSKVYSGVGNEYFNDFAYTSDGGIIIVGQTYGGGDFGETQYSRPRAFIAKLDGDGEMIWIKYLDEDYSEYTGITSDGNDGYIVAGSSDISGIVCKYNENGDLELRKEIEDDTMFIDISKVNDGGSGDFENVNDSSILVKFNNEVNKKSTVPTINKLPNGKIELIDTNPENKRDKIYYRMNYKLSARTDSWIEYTEPFEPVYDENGNFYLEVKAVNIYGEESLILKSNTLEPVSDSLTIIYNQDYGLEFNLSTNIVEFGDISGIANTELEDCVTATVSSSLPFTISAKGNDFIGTNEGDIVPINKLQVRLGNEDYKNLDNSSIELLTDTSGTGKTYPISLNLQATKGYKLDNYRTDLTFTVTQN